MAEKTKAELKTYFETDDKPTESEFSDLVDSVPNIKDNGILVGGEDDIAAHAGGGQANAYQLTKKINKVKTCASDDDSIKLPESVAGMECVIWNNVNKYLRVFPYLGEYVGTRSVNVAAGLDYNDIMYLHCYVSGKWMLSVDDYA